jgi:hypothetical protein
LRRLVDMPGRIAATRRVLKQGQRENGYGQHSGRRVSPASITLQDAYAGARLAEHDFIA